jgi:hypothetical protein
MKTVLIPMTPQFLELLRATNAVRNAGGPFSLQVSEGPVFDAIDLLSPTGITKIARFVRDVVSPDALHAAADAEADVDMSASLDWRLTS